MALLVAGGAVSGSAQLLLLAAFRRVGAATLAPLNYVQLLLAVLISTLWFQRPPDGTALAGMALIAVAGVYLARTQRPARNGPRKGPTQGAGMIRTRDRDKEFR